MALIIDGDLKIIPILPKEAEEECYAVHAKVKLTNDLRRLMKAIGLAFAVGAYTPVTSSGEADFSHITYFVPEGSK